MVPDLTLEELEEIRANPDYTEYVEDDENLEETSDWIYDES